MSSDESSETEFVLYDENDEDFRNFRTFCEETRARTETWERAATSGPANSEQLALEMWSTLRHLSAFMRDIELRLKSRKLKQLNNMTGDWTRFCKEEEDFRQSMEAGKTSMEKLLKAMSQASVDLTMPTVLMPSELYCRISNFEESFKKKPTSVKMKELGHCLREVVGRFARICQDEGIPHRLPILSPSDSSSKLSVAPKMRKHPSAFQAEKKDAGEPVNKEPESRNIFQEFGDIDAGAEIEGQSAMLPCSFLAEYCKRDKTVPLYEDMGTIGKANFNQEQVVICKVRNMSGEGKSKKKAMAKQCAAAMLIKSLLNRQNHGKLHPDARQLSEDEKMLAIQVMSEVLDFEKELEKISVEEYHRPPFYTNLVNTIANHVRCKALGYNAVGFGRTKAVARRTAAKLILDLHKEAKEEERKKNRLRFEVGKSISSLRGTP